MGSEPSWRALRMGSQGGLFEASWGPPFEQAQPGAGPFERTREGIWAQSRPGGLQKGVPNRASGGPILSRAREGPGPFERTRACISQYMGPKGGPNRASRGPILRPLFGASWEAPGHLNVREKGFGPIPAQKGLRIGSQEGPNRPPWGPHFEAKSLCMPPCFKDLLFIRRPHMGPPEGPF